MAKQTAIQVTENELIQFLKNQYSIPPQDARQIIKALIAKGEIKCLPNGKLELIVEDDDCCNHGGCGGGGCGNCGCGHKKH